MNCIDDVNYTSVLIHILFDLSQVSLYKGSTKLYLYQQEAIPDDLVHVQNDTIKHCS
jgi:hypothetical protein